MTKKPSVPRRPDALSPNEVIPIQDPPNRGVSLQLYRFLYANLIVFATFGAAFAVFGTASFVFRAAPVHLASRDLTAQPERLAVREMALFLETPQAQVLAQAVAPMQVPVAVVAAPVVTIQEAREPASEGEPGFVFFEAEFPESPPQSWVQRDFAPEE